MIDAEVAKVTEPEAVIKSGGEELKKSQTLKKQGTDVQSPAAQGLTDRIDEAVEVEYLKESAGGRSIRDEGARSADEAEDLDVINNVTTHPKAKGKRRPQF